MSGPAAPSLGRIILASAGTGKTFALTGELIARLHDAARAGARLDPARVLAITFTRKAAGEMRDRLLRRLAEASLDPQAAGRLAQHTGRPIDARGAAALLDGVIWHLHRLAVSTIDAHVLRLAGAFALELPAPPGWAVAPEERLADQRRTALRRALGAGGGDSAGGDDEAAAEVRTLVEMFAPGRAPRDVLARLEADIGAAHAAWSALAGTPGQLSAWEVARGPGPTGRPLEPDALAAAVGALRAADDTRTRTGEPSASHARARIKAAELAAGAQWPDLCENTYLCAAARGGTYSRLPVDPSARAPAARLIEHAVAELRRRLHGRNLALRGFVERYDAHLRALRLATGDLGFGDVPALLLAAAVARPERLDDACFRLDARVDHAMLDEFQDTSVDQFRLLLPLLEEIIAGGTGAGTARGRSVFIVGDEKQSLYAWRGAEPELLAGLPARWPQLQRSTLDESYRSCRQVLDTVNAIMAGLADGPTRARAGLGAGLGDGPDELPAVAAMAARFRPHRGAAALAGLRGLARLVEIGHRADDQHEPGTTGPRTRDRLACALAARRVQELLASARAAGRRPPSVAVLLRENKLIPRVIAELRELGIHAAQEGGAPLTDSGAVQAALSVLELACSPGDEHALYHAAFSTVGRRLGLVKPSRWPDGAARAAAHALAHRLRRRAADEGLAATVRWIVAAARSGGPLRPLDHARLGQLADLAAKVEAEGAPAGLEDFLRVARSRAVQPPPDGAGAGRAHVRVMTIHASKGLEFDAVILPRLEAPWNLAKVRFVSGRGGPGESPDPLAPLAWASLTPERALADHDPELADMRRQTLDRLCTQELCGLYVAITRARLVLEMMTDPPPKDPSAPSAARTLRATLPIAEAPTDDATPDSPLRVLWSDGDDSWVQSLPEAAATPTPPAPEPLRLTVTPAGSGHPSGRTLRAARVSPSALEGTAGLQPAPDAADFPPTDIAPEPAEPFDTDDGQLAADSADPPPPLPPPPPLIHAGPLQPGGERAARARRRGSLVHMLLEQVEWLETAPRWLLVGRPGGATTAALPESIRHAARRLGADEPELIEAVAHVGGALAGAAGRALSAAAYAQRPGRPEVYRERTFAVYDPSARAVVAGAIDRLVVGRLPGADGLGAAAWAEVVDFKTDQPPAPAPHAAGSDTPTADALSQRVRHYAPQVRAYAAAVALALDLPPERVGARLVFTAYDAEVVVDA